MPPEFNKLLQSKVWHVAVVLSSVQMFNKFIYSFTPYSGKKGTSFFTKPQKIQRDDVGPSREEATSILSTGYEISPS